jgi:hypothetical protein
VYLSNTEKVINNPLSYFTNKKTLLQDFNEIDRYLLEILTCHLNDIEDIKKWGIEIENKTLLEKIH